MEKLIKKLEGLKAVDSVTKENNAFHAFNKGIDKAIEIVKAHDQWIQVEGRVTTNNGYYICWCENPNESTGLSVTIKIPTGEMDSITEEK